MTDLITLDIDGTLYDSWACCGRHSFSAEDECSHLRTDTLAKILDLRSQHPGSEFVVLSYRYGLESCTRLWLSRVCIEVSAVYVPGSQDSLALGVTGLPSQEQFKVQVAEALIDQGHTIVGGFDDNPQVIWGLRQIGIEANLVEHLVTI